MKLYLLERDPEEVNYDVPSGFVILAGSEEEAREIARQSCFGWPDKRTTDPYGWLDPKVTTCEEIEPEGIARVILCDFRHG